MAGLLIMGLAAGCAGPDAPVAGAEPSRAGAMQCGALPITVRMRAGEAMLETPNESWALEPIPAVSGARYQAVGEPDTEFRHQDGSARLTLRGEILPACLAPGEVAQPFVARGNEPFWRLVLDGDTLTLDRLGHDPLSGRWRWAAKAEEVSRGSATLGGAPAALTVRHELCRDSMSGIFHPRSVVLAWNANAYSGCGGDPERLLRGVTWVVEAPTAHGLLASPRPTLTFLADGRVAGHAGCNRYTGTYELTGEGLSIRRPAVTRMACAADAMEQEQRFLDRLAQVHRFRIAADGSLALTGTDGPLLLFRPR